MVQFKAVFTKTYIFYHNLMRRMQGYIAFNSTPWGSQNIPPNSTVDLEAVKSLISGPPGSSPGS